MDDSAFAKRQRTIVACIPCRRRKVKCNGAKPCCKHCLQVGDTCRWPSLGSASDGRELVEIDASVASPTTGDIPENHAQILIRIFFSKPHLAFIRQSIHQPSFEAADPPPQSPFLLFAICSLAALYISDSEVVDVFNGETANDLSQRLAKMAHKCSRETSDEPTVMSLQANVILGFRELCCRSTTGAWMYTGLAIRMAQEMRVGKEYFQKRSPREREIRRRALWTCFVMDRMLCFLTARPQVFRTRQISVQLPCPARNFLFDEDFRGPGIADFPGSVLETAEVLPYFIKAVDLWGVLIDLFGTVGNSSPDGLVEYEDEFSKAHNTVLGWIGSLPPRMTWSIKNYRIFGLLGEGNLFVSMHMILNHALCTLQQAHLPQAHTWLPPGLQSAAWSQEIAALCCHHANVVSEIACSLYRGDENDRESLRSPFSGAAIVSAACVHLWNLHFESQTAGLAEDVAGQTIATFIDILRSWQKSWPIVSSWIEIIELISALYAVAYGKDGAGPTEQNDTSDPSSAPGSLTGAAGLPEPSNVSPRLFEKIRHIMFTISEPSALRQLQSRLHIRNLWSHMCLQAQMTSMSSTTFADANSFTFSMDDSTDVPFGWNDYMTILDGQESLQ